MTAGPDLNSPPRALAARVGICLLNLLQPGLGLIRIGRYAIGAVLLGANVVFAAALTALRAADVTITYDRYVLGVALLIVVVLVLYGAAIMLSWRHSPALTERKGWLWRWYGVLGLWGLVAAVSWPFTSYTHGRLHNFYIASLAMAPTLLQNDRTIAQMDTTSPIARGEVVIVRVGQDDWVKRVVAVPGDTVAMREGVIVLNGAPVVQRLVGKEIANQDGHAQEVIRLREQIPGEARPHDIYDTGATPQDNTPQVKLGADQYFLLGDNRDDSMDSRFDSSVGGLGSVPRASIKGHALFRYWRKGVGLAEGKL